MTRALVLVGPMAAGKSSIGKRVARQLKRPFADTDKIISRDHGPIADIFRDRGEPYFRELERAAVRDALSAGGVVALGGGAVLNADTRGDFARHDVVLLTVSPQVVAERIRDSRRPLLGGEDALARWERILAERMPLYQEVADATFDTSGPIQRVIDSIAQWAREQRNEGSA